MAQSSWPFHDGASGTPVLEDQWSIMARQWAPSGVVAGSGDELECFGNSSGMEVHVKAGRACLRGHWYSSTAVETLPIAANSSGYSRTDRVVLRLDPSEDSITLAVKAGTPAEPPLFPALTVTDTGIYELAIGHVIVGPGATQIHAGNVGSQRTLIGSPVTTAGADMTGPLAMGGSKVTGLAAGSAAGDAVRFEQVPVGGQASVTTDGSGYANITHGMGTTPSWAVVTWESSGSPWSYFAIVVSRTSTVIQVRVYAADGSTVDSTAVKLNWVAR